MRVNRIIVAALVLIGFGSCAHRGSKSKAKEKTQQEQGAVMEADSVEITPIRVMYGSPARPFRPDREVREKDPQQQNTETTETAESPEAPSEK